MFLIKLLSLLSITFALQLQAKERWITLPLADSYEHEILHGQGALTMHEYWEVFKNNGLDILHLEVQKELAIFESEEELKKWIGCELAPLAGAQADSQFVENTFRLMKARGWINLEEGKIAFPRKKLLVCLEKK